MSLKLRKTTNSDQSLSLPVSEIGKRLTAEMSSAIKRQEQISRADYWKTGFSGLGLINSPNGSHKRPNYNTLGRVSLDQVFPGLFLPNAISARHQKLRERVRLAPAIVFSRSRTTLAPSVSPSPESLSLSPRRVSVPRSTSMQLGDQLLSPTESSFSGLLTLSPTSRRYIDTFSDEGSASDEDVESPDEETKQIISKSVDSKGQITKPKIIKGKRSNSLPAIKYRTIEPYENQLKEIPVQHISSPTTVVVTKVLHDKQAKPILKKSDNKFDSSEVAYTGSKFLVRSNTSGPSSAIQQSKSTQTLSPDGIPYPHGYTLTTGPKEVTFQRPREYTIPVIHGRSESRPDSRSDSRKRSVTFNVDNKVHEYVPHEPICS